MIDVLVDAELTRGFAGAAVIDVAVLVAGVGDAVAIEDSECVGHAWPTVAPSALGGNLRQHS